MAESIRERLDRVKRVFSAPFQRNSRITIRGASDTVNSIASPVLKIITGGAIVGSAAYLAASAAGAAAGGGAAASSTTASSAAAGGLATGTLKTAAIAGGVGFVAGSLRGGGSEQTLGQDQTTTPQQPVNPTQASTSDIAQDAFADASGDATIGGGEGNIIDQRRYIRSSQDSYSYITPEQITIPTQTTTSGLQGGQTATTTDFLIPALIIGGAMLLRK